MLANQLFNSHSQQLGPAPGEGLELLGMRCLSSAHKRLGAAVGQQWGSCGAASGGSQECRAGVGGEKSRPTLTVPAFLPAAPGADEHAHLARGPDSPLHLHADGPDPHRPGNQTRHR